MKIAYLCQAYPPMTSGSALTVQRLAGGMAARGHSIVVIAASDTGESYSSCADGFDVVRLSSAYNPFRVGQRFMVAPRREVRAVLRDFRPDVLHLHDPTPVGLIALHGARALGAPVALTVHQLPWFAAAYTPPVLRNEVETCLWSYGNWLLRQCAAVITPSHVVAETVREHGACQPQVISNGVDLHRFCPRPDFPNEAVTLRRRFGLHPNLPVILHVGRIDVDKQVELVIRAAALVLQTVEAQLLVVGDGTQRSSVTRLSRDLGIGDRSHFPGMVAASGDLPGLYRLASIFTTASEIETQGLVVLEAAASGLPVVAVRATSLPELVQDGKTGYLVATRDVAALADRIRLLLRDPDRARAMGAAARDIANRHSFHETLQAHASMDRALIDPPRPGRI